MCYSAAEKLGTLCTKALLKMSLSNSCSDFAAILTIFILKYVIIDMFGTAGVKYSYLLHFTTDFNLPAL